jgi:hypothetical protein
MPRSVLAAAILVAVMAAALTAGPTAEVPASEVTSGSDGLPGVAPRHPSPEETRAEFLQICQQLRQGASPFFGRREIEELEARLVAEDREPPVVRVGIRGHLAFHHLRLGEPERALEVLQEAWALLKGAQLGTALEARVLADIALAHLVLAERQNCVHRHHPRSCLLPIGPESRHPLADHTRKAGDHFLESLKLEPGDVQRRWLLNLSRMLSGDYPEGVPPPLRVPEEALRSEAPFPRWPDVAPALGLNVLDLAGGAVVEDFDGDGLLDVVTSTLDPCGSMRAFRNEGDGTFTDVTRQWGLHGQLGGLNLVAADYDNDGRVDLLVLRGAWMGEHGRIRSSLLRNEIGQGAGRFVDVTRAAGLAEPAYPTQAAAWADFNGNGWLDLYIGSEAEEGHPYPSRLLRNNGDGTFTDVTKQAGVANLHFAKGVAWGDFDNDGLPDLYVSNIGPNRLYRNNGDGTFTDVAPELGVTGPSRSFPVWFFDFDNDGWLDLFVADYSAPMADVSASYMGLPVEGGHPVLYRNTGGRFQDVSSAVGLTRPVLPMGANFGDLDNDGWLDLYLGTGIPDLPALMPNVMLRNRGGRRFEDVTFAGGFGHLQKGHGVAFADFGNDGQQDVFVQMGGLYPVDSFYNALFANPGNDHRWVTLRLVGVAANRSAIGARIAIEVSTPAGKRVIHRMVGTGGSFGASPLRQEIGLGDAEAIERITVRWPGSGTVQTFRGVALDRHYQAVEGEEELRELELPRFRWPRHLFGGTDAEEIRGQR